MKLSLLALAVLLAGYNAWAETKSITAEATTQAGPDYLIPPEGENPKEPAVVWCEPQGDKEICGLENGQVIWRNKNKGE